MDKINLDLANKLSDQLRFSRDKPTKNIESLEVGLILSKHQLENALLVTKKITPKIYETIKNVTERLHIENDIIEAFITPSSEMNATVFSAHSGHCAMIIHSELIEKLNEEELSFVIGHEMGHFLLDHVRQENTENNTESLRQRRAQEISCDRIGLWACGDINVALNTLIKLTSGLSQKHLGIDSMAILDQMRKIDKESNFDRSNSSHPPWFIRAFALFHFSLSDFFIRKNEEFFRKEQIKNIDKRIEKKLDDYIDNSNYTLNKIVENYQFWYVTTHSLKDGKLSKQEQKILQEKFGDQKLKRLINILSESSQEEVNNFISEKMADAQNQLQNEIPKDFKKISNDIKDFCSLNLK